MIDELLGEAAAKMDQAIQHVQAEFSTVRTGRANAGILHRVMVDYYGALTPLQQLASIAVPEPQLLVISPYDKSSVSAIEKGDPGLGSRPQSGERRQCLAPRLSSSERGTATGADQDDPPHGRGRPDLNTQRSTPQQGRYGGSRRRGLHRRGATRRGSSSRATDARIAKIDQLVQHKETELLEV